MTVSTSDQNDVVAFNVDNFLGASFSFEFDAHKGAEQVAQVIFQLIYAFNLGVINCAGNAGSFVSEKGSALGQYCGVAKDLTCLTLAAYWSAFYRVQLLRLTNLWAYLTKAKFAYSWFLGTKAGRATSSLGQLFVFLILGTSNDKSESCSA